MKKNISIGWLWALWSALLWVVSLGALTRLLDAGLGCPDWPGCYGWLMPPSEPHQLDLAHQLFTGWPVEIEKAWMEMIHRYFASALGVAILFQAWKLRRLESEIRNIAFLLVGLVCLQGAFGAWTVTMKLWPPIVTGHLMGGFLLLMCQSWLLIKVQANQAGGILKAKTTSFGERGLPSSLKFWVIGASLLLCLQIFLGGWTSSQYAGLVCPDFPMCQGRWWPDRIQAPWSAPWPDGQEALGGLLGMADRMAIHLSHRAVAILLLVFEFALLWKCWRLGIEFRRCCWVAVLVLIQVGLGISNVLLSLPLTLALLHNTGAALLWTFHWMLVARLSLLQGGAYVARRVHV